MRRISTVLRSRTYSHPRTSKAVLGIACAARAAGMEVKRTSDAHSKEKKNAYGNYRWKRERKIRVC